MKVFYKVYIVLKIRVLDEWGYGKVEELFEVCATREAAEKVVAKHPRKALFIAEREVQQ